MDAALLHPSRFLKSQEFHGEDVTYTIAGIALEDLEDENKKVKTKGIVSFAETKKLLVINRTNSDCIKGMFGRETDAWIGKRVTFYPAPFFDNFTKENTTAIRVRGSPDLKADLSVTIALPKKKPVTVKMAKTRPMGLAQDDLEVALVAIRATIAGSAPEACDAAWGAGLGKRINALPKPEREAITAEFKARRASKAPAAPPVDEPTPPPA